ncbi:hypothetical protein AA042_16105 [Pseudomonas lundensis]|uniref:hypothetical protein n=1 Tax=Pseudomonas lundensis TaxID=86185 RepID=UPI0006426BFD|nr:hypothetical protein [Pseudomonas lundensis]AOZ14001.1 hypothetical protein AA042_16105 [Pseudomonas lundensis]QVQ78749.1 hypothetical protein KIN24_06785 [Pseudomonas lundensis]QVQ82188.1 hypothetical protein KIY13_02670 [Pseudomonas lundensis]
MQLNIQNKTSETVEVQGQTVTIAFAEGVMLSGLLAGCGRNFAKQSSIVEQYMDAELSVKAFPEIARSVANERAERRAYEAKRLQEAREHAERVASYATPSDLEVARRRAKREAREEEMRARGAAIRAANGRSTWNSWE